MVGRRADALSLEELGGRLSRLARQAIDDPRLAASFAHEAQDHVAHAVALPFLYSEQFEIGSEERAANLQRVLQRELLDDVVLHVRRCGRGQGKDRDSSEALFQTCQVAVGRAKVVPPFADAVRLVNRNQPQVERVQQATDRRVDSLWSGVEQLELARPQARLAPRPLGRFEG